MTGIPLSFARWLGTCLVLASCAVPPPDAYVAKTGSTEVLDLGVNTAGEACSLQGSGSDAQIYCGSNLEPAGQVLVVSPPAAPSDFLAVSNWRSRFDSRFACGNPGATSVFDSPAATLSCTRRRGGWPQAVLAVRVGGTLYVADGVKPIDSVLPRAIGVLSGRLPARKAARGDQSGLATRREAARAFDTQGAGAIAQVEHAIRRAALENRRQNYAAAEAAYRAAIAIQERVVGANSPALAIPLAREAVQISNQGRFAEADQLFLRAERLAASTDQIDPLARPLVSYLKALDQLNRRQPQAALVLLDKAEAGFIAIVPPDALVPRRRTISGARSAAEKMAEAAADEALMADQASSDALNGLIETRRYRAIALSALGRPQDAERALEQARDLYGGRDPRLAARFYRTIAMTADAADARGAASELGVAVDTFAKVQPGSVPLAETQLLRAARLTAEGRWEDARAECRAAGQILQTLNAGASANKLVPCLHALSLDAAASRPAVPTEMFALAQLAQGSITSRQIALAAARLGEGARDPKIAEAIRQYDEASDRLETLYRERAELVAEQGDAATLKKLDTAIEAAQDAQRDAGQARQAAAPGFSALVQDTVSASDVQALLQPGEAVAVVALGDNEGWTLLLGKDSIVAGRIEGGAGTIDKLVKRFRASMELAPDNRPAPFDTDAARQLYAAVLGPVANALTGVSALTVAPSGSLLSVPFGALLTGPADGPDLGHAPFLVRRMAISHVPSAASFVNLRKTANSSRASRAWFGMGDFQPPSLRQAQATFAVETCGGSARELAELPPLPGARKELEVARRLLAADSSDELLGPAFTAGKVLTTDLRNYRILHFATHAILPGELRCQAEPAVLTSTAPNAPDAGGAMLTASQIELMHLDADLVILAACNTGGGDGGGAGESLSGLARSFFFAGARSLLVTHWEANDATTTYLTALFLQALQTHPDWGPAMALAASQRRMLDEAVGERAEEAHPYYWAVEALIGGRGAAGTATTAAAPGKAASKG